MSKDNSPEQTATTSKPQQQPARKAPVTDETLGLLHENSFVQFIIKYQNYLMIAVLGILLLTGLLFYRAYSIEKQTKEASEKLATYSDPDQLRKDFEDSVYKLKTVAPAYAYRLANMYYDKSRYDDARIYYEYLMDEYPDSYFTRLAQNRLNAMENETKWLENEKTKRIDELNAHVAPTLKLSTEAGDIDITLLESDDPNAPGQNAIRQFMSLVQQGFFQNTYIYEVTDKIIKLGSLDQDGKEGCKAKIPFEKTVRNNVTGVIGMIRDFDPAVTSNPEAKEDEKYLNSADSRFYICLQAVPELDGKTTVIGTASGALMSEAPKKLKKGDKIKDIQILRKRPHTYEPKTVK